VWPLEGMTAPILETALHTSASEPPDFFTVEEAARVLRIGRTAAYALARTWRNTDGREGLPVVPVGRLLRVPRAALERMAGRPIAVPVVVEDPSQHVSEQPEAEPSHTSPRRATNPRPRRARSTAGDEPTLPLT
jgi:Helix-turn-helix domain